MKKPITLLLSIVMSVVLYSCGGSDSKTETTNTNITPATKTQLLIAKKWKLTAYTVDGANEYGNLDACDADDLYIFKEGGVFNADNGPTKCDPADDQIFIISTWKLSDNDTKLTADGTTYELAEITATKLVTKDLNEKAVFTYTGQ